MSGFIVAIVVVVVHNYRVSRVLYSSIFVIRKVVSPRIGMWDEIREPSEASEVMARWANLYGDEGKLPALTAAGRMNRLRNTASEGSVSNSRFDLMMHSSCSSCSRLHLTMFASIFPWFHLHRVYSFGRRWHVTIMFVGWRDEAMYGCIGFAN